MPAIPPHPFPALPARPVLIWDGDCGFCRRWVIRWRSMTGGAVDDEPYQRAAERFGGISSAAFARAIHLIEPDGTVTRAAAAGLKSLALAGRTGGLWRLYQAVPPFAWSAEAIYWLVARNRGLLDRLERALLRIP